MFRRIKYAYQRIKRGYSDEDCWSIDSHLAEIIPPMIRKLKTGFGCPADVWDGEAKNNECHKWYDIIEEIAQGFEAYQELKNYKSYKWVKEGSGYTHKFDEEKNKLLTEKYDKGMALFVKHFMDLWD
jgi:hypothetical protein